MARIWSSKKTRDLGQAAEGAVPQLGARLYGLLTVLRAFICLPVPELAMPHTIAPHVPIPPTPGFSFLSLGHLIVSVHSLPAQINLRDTVLENFPLGRHTDFGRAAPKVVPTLRFPHIIATCGHWRVGWHLCLKNSELIGNLLFFSLNHRHMSPRYRHGFRQPLSDTGSFWKTLGWVVSVLFPDHVSREGVGDFQQNDLKM